MQKPRFARIISWLSQHDYQEAFKSLLWALVIAIMVRTLIFEPFTIPSSSMYPGLKIGDYLITTKYTYGYSKHSLPFSPPIFSGRLLEAAPQRGDIVIFKGYFDPQEFYVKRVIGLPGDTVKLVGGVVYINNQAIERELVQRIETELDGKLRTFDVYVEKITDTIQYSIYQEAGTDYSSFPNTTEEYIVPENQIFLLGDNRNNSADSRFTQRMGMIPLENLVSKVCFVAWAGDIESSNLLKGNRGRMFSVVK
jgi:signal peptidase I